MKTIKDKKKFGYNKTPKKKLSNKGYEYGTKELRKFKRKFINSIKHKIFFHIPLTDEENKYLNLLKL